MQNGVLEYIYIYMYVYMYIYIYVRSVQYCDYARALLGEIVVLFRPPTRRPKPLVAEW